MENRRSGEWTADDSRDLARTGPINATEAEQIEASRGLTPTRSPVEGKRRSGRAGDRERSDSIFNIDHRKEFIPDSEFEPFQKLPNAENITAIGMTKVGAEQHRESSSHNSHDDGQAAESTIDAEKVYNADGGTKDHEEYDEAIMQLGDDPDNGMMWSIDLVTPMPSLETGGNEDVLICRCRICGGTYDTFEKLDHHRSSYPRCRTYMFLPGPPSRAYEPMKFRKQQITLNTSRDAVKENSIRPAEPWHGHGSRDRQFLKDLYFLITTSMSKATQRSDTKYVNSPTTTISFRNTTVSSHPTLSKLEPKESRAQNLYTPLHTWETRLLAILPGTAKDPLSAELLTGILTDDASGLGSVSENRLIEFEALSYTWGELIFTHSLKCNSQQVPITANLDEALRHLRLSDKTRYIWVDQLCINQSDVVEKAIQISKLFRIFRRASRVVVWLGQKNSAVGPAMEFIKAITSKADAVPGAVNAATSDDMTFLSSLIRAEGGISDPLLSGMVHLFQCSWFRRAWCVQEVFAAKNVCLHYGSVEMSWRDILVAKECLARPNLLAPYIHTKDIRSRSISHKRLVLWKIEKLLCDLPGVTAVGLMQDLRAQVEHPLMLSGTDHSLMSGLLELLARSTHLMATDNRDHIFALLGIVTELVRSTPNAVADWLDSNFVSVDYEKTTTELYQEVTKRMINQFDHLEPLYGADFDGINHLSSALPSVQNLPSWTPDWRKYCSALPSIVRRQRTNSGVKVAPPDRGHILQDLSAKGTLRITGFTIGKVMSTGRFSDHSSSAMPFPVLCRDTPTAINTDEENGWGMTVEHTKPFDSTKLHAVPGSALRYLHSPSGSSQWRGIGQPASGDLLVMVFGGHAPLILRKTIHPSKLYKLVGYACFFQRASRIHASAVVQVSWPHSSLEAHLVGILRNCENQSSHGLNLETFILI